MKPFVRASKLQQDEYDAAIAKGLNRVYEATKPEPIDISKLRAVVISDLHRGARDGADDFQRAEPAYSAALGWYLQQRYELLLLGDIEELWENGVKEVIPDKDVEELGRTRGYRHLLGLEGEFAPGRGGPGLRRIWGNHDLDWKQAANVKRYLGDSLSEAPVSEALRFEVNDRSEKLGELFFVHGHQGTDFSERFSFIARFFVRRVWRRVQASQGWLSTTPAHDYVLRAKHDTAMFRWARKRAQDGRGSGQPVLIAGHTHHPVFPGEEPKPPDTSDLAKLEAALEKARKDDAGVDQLAALRAEVEGMRAVLRRERYDAPEINDPPCYFNGGCCCYPDGDVTCLELDGAADEIRLVRWPRGRAKPDPLAGPESLREVLKRVAAARSDSP